MAFSITIAMFDQSGPLFHQLGPALLGRARRGIARAEVQMFRHHFFERDRVPNRNNWPKTHFYGAVARSVHSTVEGEDVVVSVNQVGIRQRVRGGTIRPRNVKWLTIANEAEAYGYRARDFTDLRFVPFGPNLAALMEAKGGAYRIISVSTSRRSKRVKNSEEGRVMFWLKKEVYQEGDDTVLPSDQDVINAALGAIRNSIASIRAQNP